MSKTFVKGDIVNDKRTPYPYGPRGVVITVLPNNRYRVSWIGIGVEIFDASNIQYLEKELR